MTGGLINDLLPIRRSKLFERGRRKRKRLAPRAYGDPVSTPILSCTCVLRPQGTNESRVLLRALHRSSARRRSTGDCWQPVGDVNLKNGHGVHCKQQVLCTRRGRRVLMKLCLDVKDDDFSRFSNDGVKAKVTPFPRFPLYHRNSDSAQIPINTSLDNDLDDPQPWPQNSFVQHRDINEGLF